MAVEHPENVFAILDEARVAAGLTIGQVAWACSTARPRVVAVETNWHAWRRGRTCPAPQALPVLLDAVQASPALRRRAVAIRLGVDVADLARVVGLDATAEPPARAGEARRTRPVELVSRDDGAGVQSVHAGNLASRS